MAGITSTKKIKGQPHLLAYITPNEVKKLKALGGEETMTKEGIPAYPEFDNYTDVGGGTKSEFEGGAYGGTGNANDGVAQQYNNQGVDPNLQEAVKKQAKINKAIKDAEDTRKAGFRTTASHVYSPPTFAQNFKNSLYQNSLNRNKVLAMRKMSLMQKGLPGMYGALISGVTGKVPDWAQNMTEEEMKALGADIQGIKDYNQATYNLNLNPTKKGSGSELLGRVFEGQNLLDKNLLDQTKYEELFPGNIPPFDGRGNEYILPQYAMMGGGADMGSEDVEEKTYDYHLGLGGQQVGANVLRGYQANGGRITRAGGGIMNAVPRQGYFLGGIGKSIGKAVKGVAKAAGKVLKSDVGKMAMLAGGAYLAGGYLPGGGGITGGWGNFRNLGANLLLKDPSKAFTGKNLSLMKMMGLSAALPFIPGINKAPENEDIGMTERGGRLIDPLTGQEGTPASMRANIENAKIEAGGDPVKLASLNQKYNNMLFSILPYENYGTYAQGGRIKAQEGGLMNLGGMEKDYRAEGGFVPIGKAEKADDVPARLSVNEFVFTADAVRNAGGGDIDKGAEVMENMMKNLENGGRVSEESQGNTGAQQMFSVSERIGEVI
jgi:hypothetical protein